jgi:hypothetical protein
MMDIEKRAVMFGIDRAVGINPCVTYKMLGKSGNMRVPWLSLANTV